jgi:hypothetical protein
MPNYCENTLVVHTTKEVWDNKLESLLFVDAPAESNQEKYNGKQFSLNAVHPMPQELQGTTAPATVVSDEDYEEWYAEWSKIPEDEIYKHMSKKISETTNNRLLSTYGYNNWYDWRVAKWGTKWDADTYNISYESKDVDGTERVEVTINFNTAWSPPEGWFNKLCKEVEGIGVFMELRYSEEGMGFAGTYYFDYDEQWEADGEIYQVDDANGERVKYDDELCKWRNESGKFVSEDSVRSEIVYDINDLGG